MPELKNFPVRRSGTRRIGVGFAALVFLGLLLSGVGLLQSINNRRPITLSCEELPGLKHEHRWVRLTNCELDLPAAAVKSTSSSRRPSEVFLPVRSQNSTGKVHVLLETRHPILIASYLRLQRLKSPEEASAWVLRNRELAFPKREVVGMARAGFIQSHPELTALRDSLAADFVFVEESARPKTGWRAGLIGVGILVGFLSSVAFLKTKSKPG